MFKRLFLILFCIAFCFTGSLCAQEVFDFGFYGGTNVAKLNERYFDYDNRWGYQAGMDWKVGNKWCQGEIALGYLNMGNKYKQDLIVGPNDSGEYQEHLYSYKSNLHYIDIPASFALGWWNTKDGGFGITVSGGAYMAVGVGGKINVTADFKSHDAGGQIYESFSQEYSTKYFGDKEYQYKRLDAGWTVGLRLGLGNVVRIAVSYRHGLTNLSNIEGYKVTNRALILSLIFNVAGGD